MDPRAAAAASPRAEERARRAPHDPAPAVAAPSRPRGIVALGDYPRRRFAGTLPDPHGAARSGPSVSGWRDYRSVRRTRRFRRALPAFRPNLGLLAGARARGGSTRPQQTPLLRAALYLAVARDEGPRGGDGG